MSELTFFFYYFNNFIETVLILKYYTFILNLIIYMKFIRFF